MTNGYGKTLINQLAVNANRITMNQILVQTTSQSRILLPWLPISTLFSDSVNEIAQLFPTSECIDIPINHTKAVIKITKITESDVAMFINVMRSSKARDVFEFTTDFPKEHKDVLVRPITHLVNLSFKHSVVPSVWKVAVVTQIF